MRKQQPKLFEGLRAKDLDGLVDHIFTVDQYRSKMGEDKDIVVLGFRVDDKFPAIDLVEFIEKGYPWVIDADVSSGEMYDGDYIVFVEGERSQDLPENIIDMMEDIMNLTDQDIEDWRLRYQSKTKDHKLDVDTIKELVPLTAEDYKAKYGKDDLDKLKTAAGVPVDTTAPVNDFTESLRVAAGIK